MSTHTPGPWSVQLFEGEDVGWIDGLDPCHYLLNKEGERFALVSTPTNPETLVSGSDIRLIAAAPELLAALDEIAGMVEALYATPEAEDDPFWQVARAAINKATKEEA